jgi:ADP-heptose:LPS heptosyltransferase
MLPLEDKLPGVQKIAVLRANALGAPTVTIFGAGNPSTNGPLQEGPFRVLAHPVRCRPCGQETCSIGYACLKGITVGMVLDAADELIRLRTP